MENQHRHIKGYRELSQEEIDLMNLVKGQGTAVPQIAENIGKMILSVERIQEVSS